MGLLCILLEHRHSTELIWHDNLNWRTVCVRCDAALIRDHAANRWRAFGAHDLSSVRKDLPTIT